MLSSQIPASQQRLLPSRLDELVRRLGQELSCAICLGLLAEPAMTPCLHAFCRSCLDQMLRIARKTDAPCPVCKTRITRRSLMPGGRWAALADAFRELADEYRQRTGRDWDEIDQSHEDRTRDCPLQETSVPTSKDILRLQRVDEQLSREIEELDALIEARRRGEIKSSPLCFPAFPETETLAMIDPIQFPSSPEDLFCRIPTQSSLERPVVEIASRNDIVLATSLVKKGPATDLLHRFLRRFPSVVLSSTFDEAATVTHLVTPTRNRVAKRTLKFLRAMLRGCWILSTEWMEACLQQDRLLAEMEYEITGDEYHPEEAGPRRARLSKAGNESPLLSGHSFYLYGSFSAPSRTDLQHLVADAGAHLIRNVSDLAVRRRLGKVSVLCDPKEQANFEKDAGIIAKFRPLLASSWLLDCIGAFQIVDPTPHIVL